jgi:hypothetical protein
MKCIQYGIYGRIPFKNAKASVFLKSSGACNSLRSRLKKIGFFWVGYLRVPNHMPSLDTPPLESS